MHTLREKQTRYKMQQQLKRTVSLINSVKRLGLVKVLNGFTCCQCCGWSCVPDSQETRLKQVRELIFSSCCDSSTTMWTMEQLHSSLLIDSRIQTMQLLTAPIPSYPQSPCRSQRIKYVCNMVIVLPSPLKDQMEFSLYCLLSNRFRCT